MAGEYRSGQPFGGVVRWVISPDEEYISPGPTSQRGGITWGALALGTYQQWEEINEMLAQKRVGLARTAREEYNTSHR